MYFTMNSLKQTQVTQVLDTNQFTETLDFFVKKDAELQVITEITNLMIDKKTYNFIMKAIKRKRREICQQQNTQEHKPKKIYSPHLPANPRQGINTPILHLLPKKKDTKDRKSVV